MEKRAVSSIVVCTVLFLVWVYGVHPLIWPPVPVKPTPEKEAPKAEPDDLKKESDPTVEVAPDTTEKPSDVPAVAPLYPSRTQELQFGKYRARFTSRGGGIETLHLIMEDGENVSLLAPMELDRPHYGVTVPGLSVDLGTVDWNVLYDEKDPGKITLEYPVENKWKVTKVFTFDPEKHLIRFLLEFVSIDGKQHEVEAVLHPFNGIVHDSEFRNAEYCQGLVGVDKGGWSVDLFTSSQVILPEHKPTVINNGDRGWLGLKNRYFTAVLIPEGRREIDQSRSFNLNSLSTDAFYRQEKRVNVVTSIPFKSMFVGDKARTFQYATYLGPIEAEVLSEAGRGLEEIYDPSGFNIVAGVIIAILSFFHSLVGNYGVAILLTTIVIRICIFPLTKKSQVSMHGMSKLQPKIKILRERYKDDQQKMGMEQMKLFRENNVNPMSGCLPILLQFPIFIGMYGVLDFAFALRHQPFFGWIQDLSLPDRLIIFDSPVTLLFFEVDALNLLPIIMTITWFLQSYMTPKPEDPQMQMQAKMMMYMPIFFGFICYNLASGLSFYFFVNSLLSMGEMRFIKKVLIPKMEANSSYDKGRKSWTQKLKPKKTR